tara:strand:+ start:3669 stop:4364 length:696 start_codon:yes stop_codon:yes gene_type:complete
MAAQHPKAKPEAVQALSDMHSHCLSIASREIYLHSYYGGDADGYEAGVDYRMGTCFVKNLHLLERQSSKTILVHQHTFGGDWNDGMAMFNAIQFSKSPIVFLCYAHARSMSSIILQACDKRVLMPDCDFMIHYGSIEFGGTSIEAKSAVDLNEKLNVRMLDVYASRCKDGEFFKDKTPAQIKTYLDKKMRHHSDWYITPEEAVYYGFADGVMGTKGFETLDKIKTTRKRKV